MPKLTANQQRWQFIIEDWQQSGLSQSQYCRQHRLNVNRFYSWKNQLKKKLASSQAQEKEQGVFLPVAMESAGATPASLLRIRVRDVEIDVSHQTDPDLLKKAIQWLGGMS